MSAKARHGKHLSRSKRKKGRHPAVTVPQPPAVSRSSEPVALSQEAALETSRPVTQPRPVAGRPANIMTELRRAAILGGIALALLVVLALVLA